MVRKLGLMDFFDGGDWGGFDGYGICDPSEVDWSVVIGGGRWVAWVLGCGAGLRMARIFRFLLC